MTRHTHKWRYVAGYSDLEGGQRCDECGERRRLLWARGGLTTTRTFRAQPEPRGAVAKGAGPDDLAEGADEPKDPADERNDEDDDHQWEDDGGAGHANGYSDTGVRWRFV